MTDNVDEFLAHYGVLGMKWGKRSAEVVPQTVQKRIAKQGYRSVADDVAIKVASEKPKSREEIQKRVTTLAKARHKLDGNKILEGYQNNAAGHIGRIRRDGTEKIYYAPKTERGARAFAKARLASEGVLAAGVIIGGGSYAVSKASVSPQNKKGAQISLALLAGTVGLQTVSQIRSIDYAKKANQIQSELFERQQQLGQIDGKKVDKGDHNAYVPSKYRD